MKIFLTLITLVQFCFAFGQTFNIATKNIELDFKELIKPATQIELTHAVKYKGEFYCFFNEVKHDNLRRNIKFCFVFSDTSKSIRKIKVPAAIQNTYYFDLFVKDDKMLVKTYMDSKTFRFNSRKSKWRRRKNADDLIFEDEKFYVYSVDFGEWGGKTWFKDKKTGLEYEIESRTPVVNKIDSTYYLTTSLKVLKIVNPFNLNKCSNDYTHENIEKEAKYAYWNGKPIGFDIMFQDTEERSNFDFSYRPHIVSSFVLNNELLHIYETDTATYIAKVEHHEIKPFQIIGYKQQFYNWSYSYRNRIQKDGMQLLKFTSDNKFGIIEINGQVIKTYNLILKN